VAADAPGRVALVTGAARGLGAATVAALVAEGLHVVAVDSCAGDDHGLPGVRHTLATEADLAAVAAAHGDRVTTAAADVRDPEALATVVTETLAARGRLDVVVAGAAVISGGRPLWETPLEEARAVWAVDVEGVWNTAAATLPHLVGGPDPAGARFVAIASAAGSRGLFHLAAYTMAKHAVVGLVRGLAADLVGTGVTAVGVSPGAMRTPLLTATADLYGVTEADLAAHQLLREPLAPEEVARTVAFCCSPEGRVLNGSVVAADGGFAG
jgi:SDR family mycofactocin-dependent oxidoreductase